MDVKRRRGREISPENRAKACMQQQHQPKVLVKMNKPITKVQVIYYLTRNGQLEHPHYMEVPHFVNQPLRLRDIMERFTALRGRGMPSLYSWSCKMNYKNGYVWNDLAENDIIPPSDGAEYVLKGSELVNGCSETLQQLQISKRGAHFQEQNFQAKQKSPVFGLTRNRGAPEEEEFDDDDDEEKTCYTSSTTPHSRCSRGVSTDGIEDQEPNIVSHGIPKPPILSEKQSQTKNSTSLRCEDGDPVSTRNSVLLQLLTCGNLSVNKAKNVPVPIMKKQSVVPNNAMKKSENLQREVVFRSAVKFAGDDQMIKCMSENPRFGNSQAEEKEYFSGSIVDSINSEKNRDVADHQTVLKKSNSYNEERSCKAGMGESETEEKDKGLKGKCIPRKKSSKVTGKRGVDKTEEVIITSS